MCTLMGGVLGGVKEDKGAGTGSLGTPLSPFQECPLWTYSLRTCGHRVLTLTWNALNITTFVEDPLV